MPSPRQSSELGGGAVKLRTRSNLAYHNALFEKILWKALEFVALKSICVSFFSLDYKQEPAIAKWVRATAKAAKVGKGLSKNKNAQKLSIKYWLEAVDPHHRYGRNLHEYFEVWLKCESNQPFFYWLDMGDGKEVNLANCPRTKLQQQCIKYLRMKGREAYEVIIKEGKLVYKQSGELLETTGDRKWIFVLSTSRTLYVGRKRLGCFQHSSFLAGGATTFAGRLIAHEGVLKAIWPYSGHYRPTEENLKEFISFLEDNNVDLTNVKTYAYNDQGPYQVAEDNDEHTSKTELGKMEELVLCLAKKLHTKWTAYNGPSMGCILESSLDQVNCNDPSLSPRPSPKAYGPNLTCVGQTSPRTQSACA